MKNKQFSAVVIGLAWMVSLGVVFVLGILSAFAFHLGPDTAGPGGASLTLEQREVALVVERYAGRPADMPDILGESSGERLPEQVEQALRGILREDSRDQRRMAATLLARGLPSRTVMAAIRFLQGIPREPARDQVLGCFLESWAAADGRRAMAFATALPAPSERNLAIRSVLQGWSRSQPAEAWNWAMELSAPAQRSERWMEIIINNLGAANRATALGLLGKIPESDFRDRMAGVVMDQILQTDTPTEAMAWLGEFPPDCARAAAARLAGAWAATEPQAAAAWLRGSYPRELEGLAGILREWVYTDAVAAADWVWGSFAGSDRRVLMDALAREWVGTDGPAPLAEWLNTHGPDLALDGAIEVLALRTADLDPATALVWAQSVTDPETRGMLEILIARRWMRQSPIDAAENLPLLLQSESARTVLLEPVPAPAPEPEYYPEEEESVEPESGLPEEEGQASGNARAEGP